ncbi:DMT family transporter [Aidingimonas lacisalsi]|uniref:DMT family transporter n=1 Tax=Aidingimonas lacisalsi TaxID=2604086 RepID=UPI0011D277AF|nr:DMT family transporter [Aidingimonas lacisalsi]
MTLLLSFSAMALLGMTHLINGLVAERYPPLRVAFYTHLGGSVVATCFALIFSIWQLEAVWWGLIAGIGSALGAQCLYMGLARAPFSAVVPISAVGMVILALCLSVALLGESPTPIVWLGVLLAIPAIWLIAGGNQLTPILQTKTADNGYRFGFAAGSGFAIQLHALGRIPESAAFSGITICMITGAVCLLPFCYHRTCLPKAYPALASIAGGISALGLTLYTFSRQGQLLIISIIIVSMYPLVPVILGSIVRRETIDAPKCVGIGLSMVATVLIVVGDVLKD